ncbi:dihydropteroate synthase [Mahella australiensis]|uniref:Dihydropteroate synthase n=1 Tax=Mahella australiensis (strain DSM 15567 / CIP 107919 / 50-1 BON) TaxID=697281 RepID=F3ZVJ6_MAHA5|nr:dihydropteroate synthase [Mahella australiensis]AEE96358.1 Dihydropteroate synthase [Mahella australiensis 50-1 BON]
MHKSILISDKEWQWGKRTYIMGILNVTPDSFSDGGHFYDIDSAVAQARQMVEEGADIIDVGGESTRPGFKPVSTDEEINRVVPVIQRLARELDIPISIDTYKAKTAIAAIEAGADMINDIWGFKADMNMAAVAAKYKVPICLMHNKNEAVYNNLIEDVLTELKQSIDIALNAGVDTGNIIVDPGIGFGKTWEHNLAIMRHLEEFKRLDYPILLGTSRKSFIGKVLDLPVDDRLEGTLATTVVGIVKGVDVVRVHDVRPNKRVAVMTDAMVR